MSVCMQFVSSRSGNVFNPNAGAIIDHNKSAKDIHAYFKSQLYVEDPASESPYSLYRMGRVNPESDRTTEILISAVGGIRTHNL